MKKGWRHWARILLKKKLSSYGKKFYVKVINKLTGSKMKSNLNVDDQLSIIS